MTQNSAGLSPGQVQQQLAELKVAGLYRDRLALNTPQSGQIEISGRPLLNFCSNDYLGLANDMRMVQALQDAAEAHGVGSGASPLVCGRNQVHDQLERAVSTLCKRDRAIIFSSGYLANLSLGAVLASSKADSIYQDKLNHASIIDAARLSPAKLQRYPHKNTAVLEKKILSAGGGRKLVITDAVFSMDGDVAPLESLADVAKKAGACLVVDDAHGFGVFGDKGAGTLEEHGLGQQDVPLLVATFGKAIGCAGAFVAGREDLIELLVQKARTYIYSTALAPAMAAVALKGLELSSEEAWRREKLLQLVQYFREGLAALGLPDTGSFSPIQPIIAGDAKKAVALSQALNEQGILVTAIRPPTVPANTARLRVTLSASHSHADVDSLLESMGRCWADENSQA